MQIVGFPMRRLIFTKFSVLQWLCKSNSEICDFVNCLNLKYDVQCMTCFKFVLLQQVFKSSSFKQIALNTLLYVLYVKSLPCTANFMPRQF